MFSSYRRNISLLMLTLVLTAGATFAQTSSFTYQGRLTDAGSPATGFYDLQFSLFDTADGTVKIGQTQNVLNVSVSSGVFTVTLDFGPNAFPGQSRFLEIGARPSGAGPFNVMLPRQQITSTPYAVRSLNTGSADVANNAQQLGGIAASQYVKTDDPRLTNSRLPAPGSNDYIQNGGGFQSAQFNILGNGTVGGVLTGNTVNSNLQYQLGGQRFAARIGTNGIILGPPNAPLVLGDNANVGIGTENPASSIGAARVLDIEGHSAVVRMGSQQNGGQQFEWQSTLLGPLPGMNLKNASAGTNLFTVLGSGNIGMGTTTPTARLHVNGNIKVSALGAAGTTQLCVNASEEISTCSSSRRYKTDFHAFTGGMNVVNRLQPLTYRWKSNQAIDLGFGAEDVAAVEPLLVTRNENGEVEGVKYDRLSAVFINAFKEQQAQIASLKTANETLNARLRNLEETLKRVQPAPRRR
jgi:hypothetical protein